MLFILHVYMFSCISNTASQSSFLSTQEKIKTDEYVKIYTKILHIIEGLQKHFYIMGKYISDDVFVSMTASRSSQS